VKQPLLITDLTRMRGGHVCLAGYDPQGRCVRPAEPRIHEDLVKRDGQFCVYPSAVVEFDLLAPRPQPPHTEDHVFDLFHIQFVRRARPREFGEVLLRSLSPSVAAIFEQPILEAQGYSVADGAGPRSVGTVRPRGIVRAIYGPSIEGAWDYRLQFYDEAGAFFSLKVTDLTWHLYCDAQRGPERQPADIAAELTALLKTRKVLLRIGLSRGWAEHRGRCFLQINGVYTSPDYLEGKTLADFALPPAD
jgi:hypothetical protein